MDYWSIVLALSAVLLAVYYCVRQGNRFAAHGIPCARTIPILGSLWKSTLQLMPMSDAVLEVYNVDPRAKYVGFYEMMTPTILLRDIDLIKSVTIKHFEHFRNHRNFIGSGNEDQLFSKHLFVLRDEEWKEIRNSVSPTFTSSRMKSMFVLMKDCAKRYGDTLATMAAEKNTELDLKDTFVKFTNDVVASCAFGIHLDSLKNPDNKFLVYGKDSSNFGRARLFKILFMRGFPALAKMLSMKLVSSEVEEFFLTVVAENIRERKEKGMRRPDLIQLLLDAGEKTGKPWSIEDITAQAFVFFLGGFDTVATLMSFAAYMVATTGQVQQRLQEEIDQVLAEGNGDVTYDAINGMKYLDGVVNETLRMYPVAILTDRMCTKKFELPPALPGAKPYVVQEGDIVQTPIHAIQHDPNFYTNPEEFDPDRYVNDGKSIASTLLSFGLGPRMCIGNRFALLETKALLFYLFASCNLKPCSKTVVPLVLTKKMFVMAPEHGFWIKFESRVKQDLVYANSGHSERVH